MTLQVVNWNVEWATPRSQRSPEIVRRICKHNPAIICLAETNKNLLAQLGGHTICSRSDYGHKIVKGRRKVMLWSAKPWERVDRIGDCALPPGRYVTGVTATPIGEITVIGVCIPWSGSRTERFGGTQRQWQDHEDYLDILARLLANVQTPQVVVLGDFNQPIGQRSNVPARLRDKLHSAFAKHFNISTAPLRHNGKGCIDHIALTRGLTANSIDTISNLDGEKRLSDHFGVVAELSVQR